MSKIEDQVENLLKDKIESLGYYLYDVEYVKEGAEYYLRIYIYHFRNFNLFIISSFNFFVW